MKVNNNIKSTHGLVSDRAYTELFEKISKVELKPGESVSPTQLSKIMGISRTPLQRTFTKLAENGLLDVLPQRGSYVSLINVDKVYEAFYMRNLLEQAAVKVVCGRNNKTKLIYTLEQNIANQRLAAKHKLYDEYFKNDNDFHHNIYSAANMTYIEKTMAQISVDQTRLRYLKLRSNFRTPQTIEEHQNILDAITIGDAEKATHGIFTHISNFTGDALAVHEKFPEYFLNWADRENYALAPEKAAFTTFELPKNNED